MYLGTHLYNKIKCVVLDAWPHTGRTEFTLTATNTAWLHCFTSMSKVNLLTNLWIFPESYLIWRTKWYKNGFFRKKLGLIRSSSWGTVSAYLVQVVTKRANGVLWVSAVAADPAPDEYSLPGTERSQQFPKMYWYPVILENVFYS